MKPSPTATVWISVCALSVSASLQASPVTDWRTFKADPATVLSGQGTSSPVAGTTETSAQAARVIGHLDAPLSLVSLGDQISLTFDVSWPVMTGANDNFRFALFDRNGQEPVATVNNDTVAIPGGDEWVGYWFGVRTGGTGGAAGSIRKRSTTDPAHTDVFANASAVRVAAPEGDALVYAATEMYSGAMTLELTAGGLQLSGFFGGNGTTNTFSYLDADSPFTTNFDTVGFLNGGALNADQIIFQNVNVEYVPVPEPSSIALACGGLLLFALRAWPCRRHTA